MERRFKSELDGMAAATRERARRGADEPTLDQILPAIRDYVEVALTQNIFCRGEKPAFEFGDDRTIWAFGWPVAEWVSRDEMLGGGDQELIAIRVFDPNCRESIHWFMHTADRLEFAEKEKRPRKQTRAQREIDHVEKPLFERLVRAGHRVERQVICSAGRIDILDITANEIIECKATGTVTDLATAVNQLKRYAPHYSGAILSVAVPFVDADAIWLAEMLARGGINVIEVGTEGGE